MAQFNAEGYPVLRSNKPVVQLTEADLEVTQLGNNPFALFPGDKITFVKDDESHLPVVLAQEIEGSINPRTNQPNVNKIFAVTRTPKRGKEMKYYVTLSSLIKRDKDNKFVTDFGRKLYEESGNSLNTLREIIASHNGIAVKALVPFQANRFGTTEVVTQNCPDFEWM